GREQSLPDQLEVLLHLVEGFFGILEEPCPDLTAEKPQVGAPRLEAVPQQAVDLPPFGRRRPGWGGRGRLAPFPGAVRHLFTQDRYSRRRVDAEADGALLNGHHSDGDVGAREDDPLVQPARKYEHSGVLSERRMRRGGSAVAHRSAYPEAKRHRSQHRE